MQLVEQHVIKASDLRFEPIDQAGFAAKNLYNIVLYILHQSLIHHDQCISYPNLNKQLQATDEYRALLAKVSQQVLRSLDQAWRSFFAAMQEWAVQLRIVPRTGLYRVKVVYSVEPQPHPDLNPDLVAGVDGGSRC